MTVTHTEFEGLYILEPRVFEDSRGYFFESFNDRIFKASGIDFQFVQDNQSKSEYGVIRGLHYQKAPYTQTKLIRVLEGEIYDLVLDLRKSSPSYGKTFGLHISSDNKKQLLVPKGFAHGFSVLSKTAIVLYKCDEFYHPDSEGGIIYNSPGLDLDWHVIPGKEIISEKDKKLPKFDPSVTIFE